MNRSLAFIVGTSVLLLLLLTGMASAAAPPAPPPPPFDANNFSKPLTINNFYSPLVPGYVFTYENTKQGQAQQDVVTVTNDSKVILGVKCRTVRDTVTVNGAVLEDTFDWYAQDNYGNVWYMGEDTKEYKHGVVDTSGSWQAGVGGAQPGYIMEAHPQVGDTYRQEYLPGEAEDTAEVVSITASVSVPYGTWSGNVLQTQETTPLEKSVVEQKYYAPGVGLVKSDTTKGGSAQSVLLTVTHN